MAKTFKVTLLIMLLFFALSQNVPSANAESPGLKAAKQEVSVKPEYDDPRTLVVMQGEFVNAGKETIKQGTPISFIIPKNAQINMACELTGPNNDNHECQPFTTKDLGNDKQQLTWKITKDLAPNQKYPVFLDIYYENNAKAPNKNFNYQFYPTYPVDDLSISVTAPKASTNFTTEPAAASKSQDQEGLTNYFFDFKSKGPQDVETIKVSYNKTDDKPTFASQQTGAQNTPQGQDVESKPTNSNNLNTGTAILLAVTILLLLGAVVYVLKSSNNKGNSGFAKVSKNTPKKLSLNQERKKLRQLLLDGKISEETYKELINELEA